MTTIVYFGGVLAVDSLTTRGGWNAGPMDKLFNRDGRWLTGCGNAAEIVWGIECLLRGESFDFANSTVVELLSSHELVVYENRGHFRLRPDQWTAFGSGTGAALAALHMGADPMTALRVTAKADDATGGPFHAVRYDTVQQKFITWSAP